MSFPTYLIFTFIFLFLISGTCIKRENEKISRLIVGRGLKELGLVGMEKKEIWEGFSPIVGIRNEYFHEMCEQNPKLQWLLIYYISII